jgi:hypothetical protein
LGIYLKQDAKADKGSQEQDLCHFCCWSRFNQLKVDEDWGRTVVLIYSNFDW